MNFDTIKRFKKCLDSLKIYKVIRFFEFSYFNFYFKNNPLKVVDNLRSMEILDILYLFEDDNRSLLKL